MDCEAHFYRTTYGISFLIRPGNNFARKAPPIPQNDPNLISGHFGNNIKIKGSPTEGKTWPNPILTEDYSEFLERLKIQNRCVYERYFTKPSVAFNQLQRSANDLKLTTYQLNHSPNEYVPRKDDLKWSKSKLDTSRYKYHETTYKTYYNRIEEIIEMQTLAKSLSWEYSDEELKKELRINNKTPETTYHINHCAPRIKKLQDLLKDGKVWLPPLDRYTLRRV